LLSGDCGVEEDKSTAARVPDRNESDGYVRVGISCGRPVGPYSLPF